ncbi:hypothetical protein KBZ20_12605 [Vulcanococcus limneticus Candia 3F8]|uniref:hypothetical protein n=1 Tax=Vulcanococcus limneticus TaxID=2170428 RepID=UPI000B99087D|nr:hypothetical protein [Vulcanococcus limneticus]MCP9791648.1 hypothetical protein [Vulcanococcus limneticus MW73D5]MCP9894612.1 hypothetical protein [Vulcanococcus limneticus Candia 3F8]MCP9897069.1 hypothetical protein [Vulcanococcus limneticus Candia 3B3]
MAASCLSTPLAPLRGPIRGPVPSAGSLAGRRWCTRRAGPRARAGVWPLAWLVAALLAAAALLAPEQPSAQAAICQRHNGLAACRVW